MGTGRSGICSDCRLANTWAIFGKPWPCLGEESNLGELQGSLTAVRSGRLIKIRPR